MALKHTPTCDFGWLAPEFSLQDANGKSYTMNEHIGSKGLLIAFISNHCPYVKAIAKQFSQDAKTLQASGIEVLALMPNDYEAYTEDAPEHMLRFAREYDFSFPYLVDEGGQVAKAYGAVCTPDFFGFNAKGALQYRGEFDNIGMGTEDVKRDATLLNAMLQIAKTGKGPQEQTPSMGCSIKW